MASPKELLSTLLQKGKLDPKEKEAFENMWDALHRYGRLTQKQKAWAEKVYYTQELDRPNQPPINERRPVRRVTQSGTFVGVGAAKSSRIGYINHSGTREVILITNFSMLKELCPDIKPGSKQYQKIEAFFRDGGQVLKIKPVQRQSA